MYQEFTQEEMLHLGEKSKLQDVTHTAANQRAPGKAKVWQLQQPHTAESSAQICQEWPERVTPPSHTQEAEAAWATLRPGIKTTPPVTKRKVSCGRMLNILRT